MTLDETYDCYLRVAGHFRGYGKLKPEKNCISYENQVKRLGKDFTNTQDLEGFIASVYAGHGVCHLTVLAKEYDKLFETYYIPRKRFFTDPVRYSKQDAYEIRKQGSLGWHIKNPKWLMRSCKQNELNKESVCYFDSCFGLIGLVNQNNPTNLEWNMFSSLLKSYSRYVKVESQKVLEELTDELQKIFYSTT